MGPETLEANKGSQRGGKAGWLSVALSGWSREPLHKLPKAYVSRWEIHTHTGPEPVSGLLMETLRSGTGEFTFLTRWLRRCWYAFMFVTQWHFQVICEGDSLSSPVVKRQRSFKTLMQVCLSGRKGLRTDRTKAVNTGPSCQNSSVNAGPCSTLRLPMNAF